MTDTSRSRMLHQTSRPSLQSPLKTLCVLIFHLLLTHSCRGQTQLIGPSQPIVATVGDDIILPCHLEPAEDVTAMTLEWTKSDLNAIFVHVRRAGQDLIHTIDPSYKGRTSLSIDGLKQGNISLKILKVKLSDGGKYKCFIPKLEKQSFVELFVASDAVSSPVIRLAGLDRDRGGVVLQCESKGWYPEPEVFWLDGEGKLLSAGPTETVRGPDDLYNVSSRVTVEKRHSNNFTCRVQQNNINQIRETHIIVSDNFFQSSSSPVTVGLAVSLAVCIIIMVISVFFVWKWRQNMIKTNRSHCDETEGGNKNLSKSNDTEMQPLTGTEGNTEENKLEEKQDELQQEKQKREKAESEVESKQKEIEAKQAEIQKLQDENKNLQMERDTKINEIKDKQDEVKKLDDENNLQTERDTETNELEEKQAELLQEKQKREKAESEVESKEKENEAKQAEIQKLQDENKNLQMELEEKQDELQQEKQKTKRDLKILHTQLESKLKEIQTLMSNNQESEKQLRAQFEKKIKAKQAEIQKLQEKNKNLQREQDTKIKELKEKQAELLQEKQKREKAESEVESKEKEIEAKQAEIQKLQDENKNLQTERDTKINELEEKQDELQQEKQKRERDFKILHTQLESKLKEIQTLMSNNQESEKQLKAQFEKKIEAKQAEIQKLQDENKNLQMELEKKQAELQQEKQNREKAEKEVNTLKNQLESKLKEKSSSDSQDFTSTSCVIVDEVDLNGKFVRLKNKSSKNQTLGNWKLDVTNTSNSYRFSPEFILNAGKMVTIWASDGGGSHNPPTDVVWEKQKSWGTGDQLKATLRSPMREIMDTKTVNLA